MKISTNLTEMKEPDIKFVSLVKRASSRLPIRIVKRESQENEMINLSVFGTKVAKKEEVKKAQAEVLAVVVNGLADEAQAGVVKALGDAGIAFSKVEKQEQDNTTVFSATGTADLPKDASVFRVSDSVAVVMKGFDPYCYGLSKDSTFAEQATARAFYMNVDSAASTLNSAMYDGLASSAKKSDAVDAVTKLVKDFGEYVTSLAQALPESVFKADTAVCGAVEAFKADEEKAKVKKAEEDANKAKETKVDPEKKEDPAAVTKSETDEALKGVLAAVDGLTKTVADLAKKTEENHKATEQKIEEIARKADTAANAVKTTVLSTGKPEDTPSGETTKKSDETDWRTGAFDSALHSRRK